MHSSASIVFDLHADIDVESCEAEKSILKRRLSESASEVERWVRISLEKYKNVFFLHMFIVVN